MIRPGPQFIPLGNSPLFAVVHLPPTKPRMVIAWCPPMLHEHATSVRLFSLVATELGQRGIGSVRLDYRGSGDSPGPSESLTLSGAAADTDALVGWLAEQMPGVTVMLAGVRAGAFPAAIVAQRAALPLLLWQPVARGARWLAELHTLDAEQRSSTQRFPFLAPDTLAEVPPDCLMGFRTGERLRKELLDAHVDPEHAAILVDVDQAPPGHHPGRIGFIALTQALASWPGTVDAPGRFPAREIARIAESLSDRMHWLAREAA